MPPSYLSVPGFENCLGIDSTSSGHTVRCLPKEKPSNCLQVFNLTETNLVEIVSSKKYFSFLMGILIGEETRLVNIS